MYENGKPRRLGHGRASKFARFSASSSRNNAPRSYVQAAPREGNKLTVQVLDFRSVERTTLRGFATVLIREMNLVIRDVAIHERDEKRWAQLPSKPQLDRDHNTLRDDAGKVRWVPIVEFGHRRMADAFGQRVLEALAVFQGRALV